MNGEAQACGALWVVLGDLAKYLLARGADEASEPLWPLIALDAQLQNPLNPSMIHSSKRARSARGNAADMIHPPQKGESQN
jgi:hypothetical protein